MSIVKLIFCFLWTNEVSFLTSRLTFLNSYVVGNLGKHSKNLSCDLDVLSGCTEGPSSSIVKVGGI